MIKEKQNIKPSNKNLKYWVKSLIPDKDVWFFKQKPLYKGVEIFNLKTYLEICNSLDHNNAYCHWNVKKSAKYVIIDSSNWILSLTDKEREKVYKQQIELERGLIIENCQHLLNCELLKNCICNNKIIISNAVYKKLNLKLKKEIAILYAKEQDDWNCFNFKTESKKINKVANKFLNIEGTNCLAIVLYALTSNKKYLTTWVWQQEFEKEIREFKDISASEVKFGDIAIFYDEENNIQHACFALTNSLFLNKSGQSKFNPVLVLDFKQIQQDWQGLKIKFKRKND